MRIFNFAVKMMRLEKRVLMWVGSGAVDISMRWKGINFRFLGGFLLKR